MNIAIMANDTTFQVDNNFPHWLHASLYLVIGSFATCGNIINILVVPKLTSFPESAKVFIVVLSGCDCLVGISLLVTWPSTFVDHWILGEGLCKVFAVLLFFAAGSGGSTLLLLNIDRWYAIAKPFLHVRHITNTKVYGVSFLAGTVWFCAALMYASDESFLDNARFSPVYRKCFMELPELEGFYAVFLSVVLYSQCLAIVVVYVKIWHISWKHTVRIGQMSTSIGVSHSVHVTADGNSTINMSNEGPMVVKRSGTDSKAIRTTLLVTGAYLGSWIPYTTSIVLDISGAEIPPEVHALCSLAVVCNSWWNTVVYSICNRSFRTQSRKLFSQCFRNEHRAIHIVIS